MVEFKKELPIRKILETECRTKFRRMRKTIKEIKKKFANIANVDYINEVRIRTGNFMELNY